MGIKNDECKRVSALLMLVLALSLLLLVAAAAPVQGGNPIQVSVYTRARTIVTGEPAVEDTHLPLPGNETEWDVPPLTGDSRARVRSASALAHATAIQHVTADKAWGQAFTDASSSDGMAQATAFLMADPPVKDVDIPIPHGLILKAEGSGEAYYSITLWDNDTSNLRKKNFAAWPSIQKTFERTAKLTGAGTFQTTPGEWANNWTKGRNARYHPPWNWRKKAASQHTVVHHVVAAVNSVGKAKAMSIRGPVGGTAFPVDKLALLAPYITLAIAVVAVALGAVSARKRWLGKAILPKP